MANDPILGDAVIAQAVAPSCSIRNLAADETGHLITVAASSAPSGSVTLSSSTTLFGAVLISTDTTVGLTTTATVSLTTTSVISFSSIPSVAFSTSSVIGLTTTSVVGLTSTSVIANTSFTVAGTVLVTQLTSPWQIQGTVALTSSALTVGTVVASSTNTQSVAVSSAITLSSGALTIGVLSTTQLINNTSFTVGGAISFTSIPTVDLTTTEIIAVSSVGSLPALSSGTQTIGTVIQSSSNVSAVQLTSDSFAPALPQSTLGAITTIGLTCSNAAVQLVLNANAARKGVIFQNRAASAVAFLAFASTSVICSTAAYSIQIAAGAQFQWSIPPTFTGGITGCANLLAGSTISVTELT